MYLVKIYIHSFGYFLEYDAIMEKKTIVCINKSTGVFEFVGEGLTRGFTYLFNFYK